MASLALAEEGAPSPELGVLLPSSAGEAVRDVAEVTFLPPPSLQLVTSGKEVIIMLIFVNAGSHSARKSRKLKYSGQDLITPRL